MIAKAGRPVARLVPLAPGAAGARVLGNRAGQLRMAGDFDADLDPEFLGGELVPDGER